MLPTTYAQIIVDEVSALVTYIGYNMDDFASQTDNTWAVFRITSAAATTPTGVTIIQGAQAPGVFDQVWADRVILSYAP